MSRRIVVLSGGVSVPSSTRLLADRIADAVRSAVGARGESADVEVIELRELAVDLATATTTGGLASPALEAAREAVYAADGLVAVTPVFSASYAGLFKMFVDLLDPDALDGKPVLVAATAGTARHSLVLDHAMRPLFAYLRAVVVPTGVFAATEDFGGPGSDALGQRITRAASQLAGLVVAESSAVRGFVPDGRPVRTATAPVTSFARLLQGHEG